MGGKRNRQTSKTFLCHFENNEIVSSHVKVSNLVVGYVSDRYHLCVYRTN